MSLSNSEKSKKLYKILPPNVVASLCLQKMDAKSKKDAIEKILFDL